MSVSDISLTAGMRTNLLNLRNTSTLLNRTQGRLSSGKQVNSALDNPTNYFAAQNATQRASDLSDRKDGMSEAVQTVNATNAGITAITGLINAAKGVAQSVFHQILVLTSVSGRGEASRHPRITSAVPQLS
jgi:flagellin